MNSKIITKTETKLFDNIEVSNDEPKEKVVKEHKPRTIKVNVYGQVENPLNKFFINDEANVSVDYTLDELNKLTLLIQKHGLLVPITVWWNKKEKRWELVDGRSRLEACNRLNIKVRVNELPKSTRQEELPEKVLALQVAKRGLDKIFVNCEAVLYLERGRLKKQELLKLYPDLDESMISRLTTIREVRPMWFKTLRRKEGVVVNTGDNPSRGVKALASICVKEKNEALGKSKHKESDPDKKEMAIAFTKMKPLVEHAILSMGDNPYLNDAYEILFKQKSKYSQDKYATPTYIVKITELELQLELLTEDLTMMNVKSKVDKQLLLEAQEKTALLEELFVDIKRELPKTPKTQKMMARINHKFTAKERG